MGSYKLRFFSMVSIACIVSAQAGALRLASVSNEPYPSGLDENGRAATYTAAMMLDGDPATYACLLDDSRGGDQANTKPPCGNAPVTGTLVFDLGDEYEIDGIELVSRARGGRYLPETVELFGMKHRIPAVSEGKSHVIRFTPRPAKTLEMKILSSYESGPTHFNYQIAEFRVSIKNRAGERKMLTGTGEIPSTLPEEDRFAAGERDFVQSARNRSEPYPETRQLKDWIYQDHGLTRSPSSRAARPASRSARRAGAKASPTRAAGSCSPLHAWLSNLAPNGSCGRMSPASCTPSAAVRSPRSSRSSPASASSRRGKAGATPASASGARTATPWRGECWTLNSQEHPGFLPPSPSGGGACGLSDILEPAGSVPPGFYLTARLTLNIIRLTDATRLPLPPEAKEVIRRSASRET